MQNGKDGEGFVGNISNQVAVNKPESYSAGTQIGADMSRKWISNQHVDSALNFVQGSISRFLVVARNEFPNFVDFCKSIRMELVVTHVLAMATVGAFLAKKIKSFLAVDQLNPTALDIIITRIECVAKL
jgi:hypothetical protein